MTKFKVGDRVRTKGYEGTHWDGEGTIVSVDGYYNIVEIDGDRGGFFDHELELVATPLQIEAGKFYRTRDGQKVGPVSKMDFGDGYPFEVKAEWWVSPSGKAQAGSVGPDLIAEWVDEPPVVEQQADNCSTAGFTVPLCAFDDDFDICGHRDSDGDIVQLSVGELTAALADSLKVARKVGKTIKRGDLVVLARPALVTGVDRYHASVQTDGGNYSLPLAALTAA